MHENGKVLPHWQNGGDFYPTESACSTIDAEDLAEQSVNLADQSIVQRAMEYFGWRIAELLECRSCYVAAAVRRNSGQQLLQARIGQATIDPSCTAMVTRIARKGASTGCTLLEPVHTRTTFVRKLIGPEPVVEGHSVIGRFTAGDGVTVVFIAGWHSTGLTRAEIPCLGRAIRAIWSMAHDLARVQQRQDDAATWLGVLAFPALIVDADLQVHEINSSAQSLIARGDLLKANGNRVAGRSSSVTIALRAAIHESLSSRADREWLDTTVPLSTERERFAFARIGAAPPPCDTEKALVIVPQFDEVSGARRIAAAFGLSFAEERIVTRILQGKCPRKIGADLRLTEATVRTYTKRIMLKLGINRQSEFFVLHHLTQSPFGSGMREKSARRLSSTVRLSG
ncbi:helix-turn-helix transcriptional regulator [Bradyrhizobium daqingense]|uniref:DNA-binding CsgD family transcriptional regulator n=1 Tax=Bradyrhizobium daqingense TaxID=993502 RepID=A0A562LJC6_9BRAD|nr:helix-turn-helix transcriptional regulator [Bradyrhizobium daqingense]TWI07693.1 DNA-binding CsgD family transcriptional regulator [Bradyrhizobium daqingense]UFS89985.1 helix-turn-helix transcriptional regulator [Bradyrhizobium daqingense]